MRRRLLPELVACTALLSLPALAEDPYAPLLAESRPLPTRWQTDYSGAVELGVGYTTDDNHMFGQYNGLNEDQATLIGNLTWNSFNKGDSYWRLDLSDLGLDTREGLLTWGMSDRLKVEIGFDSQLQVANHTGSTPFRGSQHLSLPDDWVSGLTTGEWSNLDSSMRGFDRELERDKYSLGIEAKLSDNWRLDSHLSYEEKQGTADLGGAIYIDAAAGDAVLLPTSVDYRNTEFDIGLGYSGSRLHVNGTVFYSEFDNKEDIVTWQNPYSSYSPSVRYPEGIGGLGLSPDNEHLGARLTGQYIFSPIARLQFDGAWSVASQDADYLPYSANPSAVLTEALPREDFDGEVETGTFNGKLLLRPLQKLNLELYYKGRERDYDAPRDGYRYIRGDGTRQPREALTVYNTAHDYVSQTVGVEASYRLPLRSRLSFDYAYEEIERENAAVEETEEDRYSLIYRVQPADNFTAKVTLNYGDRQADTYYWDQSYYALLDTELINATPDNQRYLNHPLLSQYHLSNRERSEVKVDFNALPAEGWTLNVNFQWREDDFDKTALGLTDTEWQRVHASVSYQLMQSLSATVYAGLDNFSANQYNRAFRGGQEKNAFDIYPPLPQASDPSQDWAIETNDDSITVGANLRWIPAAHLDFTLDYSFVDTESEQLYESFGDTDIQDFPNVDTHLHQVDARGTWHLRESLSLSLNYQYYRYKSNDWAWGGLQADSIAKVLTFGQRNPNEQIHYVGLSAIYRWK